LGYGARQHVAQRHGSIVATEAHLAGA
jgi:hypothetical protein